MAVSPRHMAVEITGLETALPDAQKDSGASHRCSDKAIDGFCQSTGSAENSLSSETEKELLFCGDAAARRSVGGMSADCDC